MWAEHSALELIYKRIFGEIYDKHFTAHAQIVVFVSAIIVLLLLFANKNMERWKVYALLTLTIILVTGMNYTYSIVLMVIPLVFFLNDKIADKSGMQAVYSILFVLMFVPMIISTNEDLLNSPTAAGWPLTVPAIIESAALFLMFVLICIQEIVGTKSS